MNRQQTALRVARIGIVAFALLAVPGIAGAQTIQPPYNSVYTLTDLGSVPGVPTRYGGLTFLPSDPNTIIIGGAANGASGQLFSIGVTRGAGNHITGFGGTAAVFADGAYNDGGVVYGPGGVLFLARWPVNELGQTKPGSAITDKIIPLGPFGITPSPGAVNFVPSGFPGAGQFKLVSWSDGEWYTVNISPDGTGTYNIDSATQQTTIPGGPEGFIYVPPGSPLFASFDSMLVSEYSANQVTTYTLDAAGNPELASRTVFISGLSGAEGAAIDPLTGDFLFSTFGGGNRVIVVQGFAVPPPPCSLSVTTTQDIVNSGDSVNSLREAIICANQTPGADTITVPAGTYNLTLTGAGEDAAATGDLDITESLTLTGAGPSATVIDGGGIDRVIHIPIPFGGSADVTIRGVTITNGSLPNASPSDGGGGVFAQRSTLLLVDCVVTNNRAHYSGGLYNLIGTATIVNCTFSGNDAPFSASRGGGIHNTGTLTIRNSTLSGNTATLGLGGGIYNNGGTVVILNSTVSGNSSSIGGGVHNDSGGQVSIFSSTLSGNTGTVGVGGIQNGGTLTLQNTIVGGGGCAGNPVTSNGHNLSTDSSCGLTGPGDLPNTDPILGPLANNGGPTQTHATLAGSPAIDAVPTANCTDANNQALTTDQRGQPRPFGPACDIGAYEGGTGACSLNVTTTQDMVNSGDGVNSLREAIICANGTPGADTISVPAGTYTLSLAGANEDATATGDLDITDSLTLNGAGAATTIIDGGALDRVFQVGPPGGIVNFNGLTIRNGLTSSGGAGIAIPFPSTATVTITNCAISGNTSTGANGGGISNDGTLRIAGSVISDNHAQHGGGLYGLYGTVTVTNSTISGNSATATYLNAPDGIAGGIYVYVPTTLIHVTVANNSANKGGGIYVDSAGSLTIKNTLLADNSATSQGPDCFRPSSTVNSLGYNLLEDAGNCPLTGVTAGNITGVDAVLGLLANNGGPTQTHALNNNSPAIDAVPTANCTDAQNQSLTTDQRGQPRPFGPACDIGAYEGGTVVGPATLTITLGSNSPTTGTTYTRGQTLRPMLQFVATAGSGQAVRINSITLGASGTGNDQTGVTSVKVYVDTNGNGQFNAGEPLVGSGTYNADNGTLTITFTTTQVIAASSSRTYLVTYDFAP